MSTTYTLTREGYEWVIRRPMFNGEMASGRASSMDAALSLCLDDAHLILDKIIEKQNTSPIA